MEELKNHEFFEMEVLERMKAAGLLRRLVFGGGTMLRLCHELPRYSVDLDFWFYKKSDFEGYFKKLSEFFKTRYDMTGLKNKKFTLLAEIRSPASKRRLKIEIRKEEIARGTEDRIAFSKYGNLQVLLRCMTLDLAARRKTEAALDRTEVRDFFDLEFLLRRGVRIRMTDDERKVILDKITRLGKTDYSSTLGALLPPEMRQFYVKDRFSHLRGFCEKLNSKDV